MSTFAEGTVAVASKLALPWLGSIGLPWILLACVVALLGTGGAGMYLGYEVAAGRNALDIAELKDAQIEALKARTAQYLLAVERGNEIANRFETSLGSLKAENKTFNTEVRAEMKKQIYIDCKLPNSGVALLRKRIDAANAQISTEVAK